MSSLNDETQHLSSEINQPKYDSNLKTDEIQQNLENKIPISNDINIPIEELEKINENKKKETNDEIIIENKIEENKENIELKEGQNTINNNINNNKVSWIDQVIRKNFMPAMILLEKGKINVNSYIPNINECLLHLSVNFSYYNVTRCLIEKFNADPNIKNNFGSTPLHLVCSNPDKDIAILIYLLTRENIKINERDSNGMTPIFYSIINNFEDAFLLLVSRGVDLNQKDNNDNTLMFYAILSGNLFIFNFLETHCNQISLISSNFNSKGLIFSDIAIQFGNHKKIQKILKIYYKDINLESIVSCCNNVNTFNTYSKDVYENLNTCYFYRLGNYKSFFKSFFPILSYIFGKNEKKILTLEGNSILRLNEENAPNNEDLIYENKIDNLLLLLYFIISDNNLFCKTYVFYFLISFYSEFLFYLNEASKISQFFNIIISLYVIIFLILIQIYKFDKEALIYEKFKLNDIENNCLYQYNLVNDPSKVPLLPSSKNNICEICLRIKDKFTYHCMKCNVCVRNYYFHSNIYNLCIHRRNIWYYTCSIFFFSFHFIFIGIETEYFLIKFLSYIIYIIILGKVIAIVICIGSKTPYRVAYNEEEDFLENKIEKRNKGYYSILKMNILTYKEFIKNVIK